MKRALILLTVCVSTVMMIALLLAEVGTAVSAPLITTEEVVPIESVEIIGPMTVTVDTTVVFTAVVHPPTATQPIDYSWAVYPSFNGTMDELDNFLHIGWYETGIFELQVSASNSVNFTDTTFTVTVVPKVPVAADIYTNRDMTSLHKDGLINTSNQSLLGPLSCTQLGDPYSPYNSTFRPPNYPPGPYTYHYRIFIPDTYTADTLRVELFDPDSINAATNSTTITRTNYAISQGLTITATRTCSSSSRQTPCLLGTGEQALVNTNITIDDVNIFWFMRVDQNIRPAPTCSSTGGYNANNNTPTLFELYYYSDTINSSPQRVDLASYTGQTGLEGSNHDTDLRWVSPGAPPSFDQSVFVPVDAGSPKSFQLDLNQDLPNIEIDPETNGRYLYLDVTTIGGSSENNFEIWAGPATYTATTPSGVNARNLTILNDPGSHSSAGVEVLAVGYLPQNSNTDSRVNIPLIEISPEYAGETVHISLFDTDSGTQAPTTFFFDSIPQSDWSLTFANFGIDPDGVPASSRCFPTCNNQWVNPPYQLTVPGNLEDCDYNNPNMADCTLFFGGTLFASYNGGLHDTYGWEVAITEPTDDTSSAGCVAFPIAIHRGSRSVHPPGTGTGNDYPLSGDFHPDSPMPLYTNFPYNVADVPLDGAHEGYVYKLQNGDTVGTFDWLSWNNGIAFTTTTLINSLTWPGDSLDFQNHGDNGTPPTPLYPHVVRGYVNPLDTTDLMMHTGDWLVTQPNVINDDALRDAMLDHMGNGRLLRLPVWDTNPINQNVQITGFALFRLHGHNLDQDSGQNWILFEFVEWDTSCGQLNNVPQNVAISGPGSDYLQTPITFTAKVQPGTTSQPVTYTWTATGQPAMTHTGDLNDSISYTWPLTTGAHTAVITVVANNGLGTVTDTHLIDLTPIPLTSVEITGPVTSGGLFTAVVAPANAAQPITYTWQADAQLPVSHTGGITDTAVFHWPVPATYTILITATNGFSTVTDTHTIVIPPTPILTLTLSGPTNGYINIPYTFTTTVTPISATQPITYHWQATNQPPITQTGGLSTTFVYSWATFGPKTITVTAENITSTVTTTHTIVIPPTPLLDLTLTGPTSGHINTPYTFTATVTPISATQPITYRWQAVEQPPILQTGGLSTTHIYSWTTPGPKTITVTAENITSTVTTTHTIIIPPTALLDLALTGPTSGYINTPYTFTATVAPISATQPITYHWQATNQPPIMQTGGLSTTFVYSWATFGPKTITVTAENITSTVTTTHTITVEVPEDLIIGRPQLITPLPITANSPVTFTVPITNVGSVSTSQLFFVDIYLDPTTILTTGIPISQSSGFAAVSNLAGGQSRIVTITAAYGFAHLPQPHLVYAMVDSLHQVAEADETNNVSLPLVVTDVVPLELPVPLTAVSLTGSITGVVDTTYTFTAVAAPISATQPITYLWQASAQSPITHTAGLTAVISFSWSLTGTKAITVTADNGVSVVTAVHTITITQEIIIDPPPTHFTHLPFITKHKP